MRPKRLLLLLPLLPLLPLLTAGRAAAVDPFYLGLLRDGQFALDRKDYAEASRHLNLACFGMLDEPKPLADCLTRLALAQDKADNVEGFRLTFQRLIEVEERFKAYTQGDVPPELRAALELRLSVRVPAATLDTAPAFRPAAPAGKPAVTAAKPATKPGASKPAATKPATNNPATNTTANPPAPIAAPVPSPAPPPEPVKATAAPGAPDPEVVTEDDLKKLDRARRSLAEQRPAKELKEAFQTAREVADAHPGFKEAQHLAAEGAYRLSRWSDAATYFRRGGDPGEDEPERLFYMAVALYESGDAAGSAAALKRALPNLKRTPYVDGYTRKILGQ